MGKKDIFDEINEIELETMEDVKKVSKEINSKRFVGEKIKHLYIEIDEKSVEYKIVLDIIRRSFGKAVNDSCICNNKKELVDELITDFSEEGD